VTARTVLTLDLGTSTTKAALWHGVDLVAVTSTALSTSHPRAGWTEQDPASWWDAVVSSCAALRGAHPDAWRAISVVAASAARETFALFDASFRPLGPGILWSDTRAADQLSHLGDPDEFRALTGVLLTPGCAAAKVAWVAAHDPAAFAAARWVLAPRDLVVARLTGAPVTDATLASRTGWMSLGDARLCGEALASRLPRVVPSTARIPITSSVAAELGLAVDVEVVPGAGDRACEVLGAGATAVTPMVSWGTTANLSVPHPGPVAALPLVAQVSRAALGGFLVEAGLAAAGSAVQWLAGLARRSVADLWAELAAVAPGARGVTAHPWLQGARAPWWQPEATAAFAGLDPSHTPAELARAVVEGVAFDVARSFELIAPRATSLTLAGRGADNGTWRAILAATAARPIVIRRHGEAASVGARLLAAHALAEALAVDDLNPVSTVESPDPGLIDAYAPVRVRSDHTARSLLAH
jgi:xylulokinase